MNVQIKRILVALDSSPHSRAALESAATLAERLDAELLGVFVEDIDLMQLAALPFARELGITSAGYRTLDPHAMARSLNAQAQKARAALRTVALHHHVHWTFRSMRGRVLDELRAASSDVDLIALGSAGHMAASGRRLGSTARNLVTCVTCSVLIEHARKHRGASLLLLYEDSASADAALARAQDLAVARDGALLIALVGAAATRQRLRERIEPALRANPRATVVELDDGPVALRALAQRYDCGLVLIAHDSAVLARDPELLGELGYPILVTR